MSDTDILHQNLLDLKSTMESAIRSVNIDPLPESIIAAINDYNETVDSRVRQLNDNEKISKDLHAAASDECTCPVLLDAEVYKIPIPASTKAPEVEHVQASLSTMKVNDLNDFIPAEYKNVLSVM